MVWSRGAHSTAMQLPAQMAAESAIQTFDFTAKNGY
jgi:hypothetical protein